MGLTSAPNSHIFTPESSTCTAVRLFGVSFGVFGVNIGLFAVDAGLFGSTYTQKSPASIYSKHFAVDAGLF